METAAFSPAAEDSTRRLPEVRLALANIVDSRPDFYKQREPLVVAELGTLDWLRSSASLVESTVLGSRTAVEAFAVEVRAAQVDALIVHLPIWGDPIFTIRLVELVELPVLLLGNSRPDTSSMVGLLGAGGALDQVGRAHLRVFDHTGEAGRSQVLAFARAASALRRLRGQTLGLFGGRSLGIFTTVADPAQWHRLFGVDIELIDQAEIVQAAEALPQDEVQRHLSWLLSRTASVRYGGRFSRDRLERQVRSYLATRRLAAEHGLDFLGVKCQPELSDGYVTQCAAHMLMNGIEDAAGAKTPQVHACESDADGALSMQILQLLSGGKPAALLDVRWLDPQPGPDGLQRWTLANCGALAAAFMASPEDPSGLSAVRIEPHVFGLGGGGAFPASVPPQTVTLARLCRKNGQYWLAVLRGKVVSEDPQEAARVTPAFPRAVVHTHAGQDFLQAFGSNHIHMVSGDYVEELTLFSRLAGIPCQVWN